MRRLLLVVVGLCLGFAASALEVEQGRIRLVLDEESSRFLIYLRSESEGDESLPLFFADDPRTSGLDIRVANRVYRMGDGGEFRQVAETTDEGIFFVWTSSTLRVSQGFWFIRSVGSSVADGVQLEIAITNLGEQTIPVAARLLLDTYLGERGNAHFSTPLRSQITRESIIEPSSAEWFIRSSAPEESEGLQVMLASSGVTTPASVVVANWRRLSDSQWDYKVSDQRNFNRLPYSINDSALMLTYDEVALGQSERYKVTLRLGAFAPQGYLDPDTSAPLTANERDALLTQLNALLDEIDGLLADPEVSAADVETLRADLQQILEQVRGQ